jgi:hypothetical protein
MILLTECDAESNPDFGKTLSSSEAGCLSPKLTTGQPQEANAKVNAGR